MRMLWSVATTPLCYVGNTEKSIGVWRDAIGLCWSGAPQEVRSASPASKCVLAPSPSYAEFSELHGVSSRELTVPPCQQAACER